MTTYTTQQKYDFLCAQLRVRHLDYCENDGLIVLKPSIYFQFPVEMPPGSVDGAIIEAMRDGRN